MEKIGDIETSIIQDVAASLVAKYGHGDGDTHIGKGLSVMTRTEPYASDVQIYDNGRLVFAAKTWIDGDQLVSMHRPGKWTSRLLSARS